MGKLQDYLVEVINLRNDGKITEEEIVEAFKSGMEEHFNKRTYQNTTVDMALAIDSWIQKNYFRPPYTRNYTSKLDGIGFYSHEMLVDIYKKGEKLPKASIKKLRFFDWLERNYDRKCHSVEYVSKNDGKEHPFKELVKIYSKLK